MENTDLSYIYVFIDTEEKWTVDADGQPVDHLEDTDYMSDPTAYGCNQCGLHMDTWEEALAHNIKEVKNQKKARTY